ncbi:hypothetical protein V6Z05_15110 [Leptospira venezuelensis]|uniref:hypothetical protein n=1 Tax=Leptospira venezuelensis TaxID=1958811 RepID=UPI000A3974D7|nr:hypothetical protein [Leptospira venezuelensis]
MKRVHLFYLDQNIYSRFAESIKNQNSLHPLHSLLIDYIKKGALLSPFSSTHIGETAYVPNESTKSLIINIIEQLSGGYRIDAQKGELVAGFPVVTLQNYDIKLMEEVMNLYQIFPLAMSKELRRNLEDAGFKPGNLNNLEPKKVIERMNYYLKNNNLQYSKDFLSDLKVEMEKGFKTLFSYLEDVESKMNLNIENEIEKGRVSIKEYYELINGEPMPEALLELAVVDLRNKTYENTKVFIENIHKQKEQFKIDSIKALNALSNPPDPNIKQPENLKDLISLSKPYLEASNVNGDFMEYGFQLILLSHFGYFRDKKEIEKQKSNPRWMELSDPVHFQCALHCSVFIVEDVSLRERAKFVIQGNNLKLLVLSIDEAIDFLRSIEA